MKRAFWSKKRFHKAAKGLFVSKKRFHKAAKGLFVSKKRFHKAAKGLFGSKKRFHTVVTPHFCPLAGFSPISESSKTVVGTLRQGMADVSLF